MSNDGAALLNSSYNDENSLGQSQPLSRSPHPYHKNRSALLQHDSNLPPKQQTLLAASTVLVQKPHRTDRESTYFDADHRKRRKDSLSSSDSGTEADDERGTILLGLPAPPTRLRKGLKGANASGSASPLLTPSYLDEEPRRLVLKSQSSHRASLQSPVCTEEEAAKLKEKFTRRRRAELIRRTSEAILLGAVGFIACSGNVRWLMRSYAYGVLHSSNGMEEIGVDQILMALVSHAVVVLSLYGLYPLRIIFKNHTLNTSRNRSPFYIHIPAAFEPAPLLYPVLIPLFVALSLLRIDRRFLLPNLALSVASIPNKIVPFSIDVPWYSSMQWLLSTIPIIASSKWQFGNGLARLGRGYGHPYTLEHENLLLLYPLHQALLPVLGYLTTTSLLPAELQLLSISMINLFLHAGSPQTVILQSLLWIGGLSIFVFCGKILKWEVTLARIPSWRFRKSYSKNQERSVLLSAINDSLHGRLSNWSLISTNLSDSESSSSDQSDKLRTRPIQKHRQTLSIDTRRTGATENGALIQLPSTPLVSAEEYIKEKNSLELNGTVKGSITNLDLKPQRRNTLPSYIDSLPASPPNGTLKRSRTSKPHSSKSWSLQSLTKNQAIVIKWAFALYVYIVIVAIIACIVRINVSHNALLGQEPIGWALAYLFGDIPPFRRLTIDWGLDSWIPLPEHASSHTVTMPHAMLISAANIRLLICLYCLNIIALGLAVVFRLSAVVEVDTRRKVFHGMMVAMFLPTTFIDPTFVSLAFGLILAIFLLLDLFRASQLPPLSKPLTYFLAPYVDGRDHRGPVIVSHIFLLIGCAIPLWLSLAAIKRTGKGPLEGWDVQSGEVSMVSGVVCVGMGDAAASLIGRRYGRRRWCWTGGKSLEGSLAFAVAVVLGLTFARWWLLAGGWNGDSGDSWGTTLGKASLAASGASLTEAVLTGGNDNVIVPVILWLLVRGLGI